MPKIIVALDVPDVTHAMRLVNETRADWLKIGLELIYAKGGLDLVRLLVNAQCNIFLDAKLADIPSTVERATRSICENLRPHMLSVHRNVEAALRVAAALSSATKIVHVPQFTSDPYGDDPDKSPAEYVVSSVVNAAAYKRMGHKVLVAGIREYDAPMDDHSVTANQCPEADYWVIGRSITRAANPAEAYAKWAELARISGIAKGT